MWNVRIILPLLAAVWIALLHLAFFAWVAGSGGGTISALRQALTQTESRLSEPEDGALRDREDVALHAVDEMLARFPPTPDPPPERRTMLATLDTIFHDEHASDHLAVQQFFHRQIERAVAQIQHTKVQSGATVWQMYNHGFVVRTKSATTCFDLIRAKYLPDFAMSKDLMRKIVDQCDVLFVSHVHADHAESFVAETFVDQGKPVVAPEQVGYREPLYSKILHLKAVADKIQRLPIQRQSTVLEVVIYPGHQGAEIENNVTLVTTPDGISIAHTGDQWDHGPDFEWIDNVAKNFRVDILLPNDWTYDISRMVRGFNPVVVIPGHENELGHSPEKRQPYLFSFQRKLGSSRFGGSEKVGYAQPLVVMAWGESYHYEPSRTEER